MPRRESSESYVDYSEGSDLMEVEGLRRGTEVRHPKFGVGEVQEVMQGSPPRVSVRFPGWGTRRSSRPIWSPRRQIGILPVSARGRARLRDERV